MYCGAGSRLSERSVRRLMRRSRHAKYGVAPCTATLAARHFAGDLKVRGTAGTGNRQSLRGGVAILAEPARRIVDSQCTTPPACGNYHAIRPAPTIQASGSRLSTLDSQPFHVARHPRTRRRRRPLPRRGPPRPAGEHVSVRRPGRHRQEAVSRWRWRSRCSASRTAATPLEPCGHCESCRLFDAGTHPDLDVVGLPKDKSTLPLDLFIGDKEHRNQDGLCHRIALRPFLGGRKVAIIDDADYFSQESANCLLKTLEEPPPKSLMILIGTSPSKQLPTIRSRSQVVRFQPLAADTLAEILLSTGVVTDTEQSVRLASYGEGSIERAREIADPALWQFRAQLLHDLSSAAPNPVRLAKAIQAFVDDAGKEASERRDRLRTIVAFAEEFYRGLMRAEVRGDVGGDELLQTSLAKARKESVFRPGTRGARRVSARGRARRSKCQSRAGNPALVRGNCRQSRPDLRRFLPVSRRAAGRWSGTLVAAKLRTTASP